MEWIDFQEQVREPAIALVALAVLKLLVAATLSALVKGWSSALASFLSAERAAPFLAVVIERHRARGVKPCVLLTCYVSIDAAIREAVRAPTPHASDSWQRANYLYNR